MIESGGSTIIPPLICGGYVPRPLAADSTEPYMYSVSSYTHRPFSLKEVLYGFSLAYLDYQQDDSCPLGPLLNKIRVTRTQTL